MSIPARHRPTRHLRPLTAAVLCGSLLGLGGCQGEQPDTPAPGSPAAGSPTAGSPAATPEGSAVPSVRLPVEDHLLTARQTRMLGDARTVLALSCVARLGLRPPPPPVRTFTYRPGDRSLLANTERRYGITDASVAAEYGYRPRPGTYPDSTTTDEPEMPQAVVAALTGERRGSSARNSAARDARVPADGCLGEAKRSLGGRPGVFRDSDLATRLNDASHLWSRRHPQVRAVVRDWAACMRRAGHPQTDPLDAPGPDRRFQTPRATPEEIAIALADIGCKRRTRLVEVWSGLERRYQQERIRAQAQQFAQVDRDLRTQVARAEAVLRNSEAVLANRPGALDAALR